MYNVQVYVKGSGVPVNIENIDLEVTKTFNTDITGDPISSLASWLLGRTLSEIEKICSFTPGFKISFDPDRLSSKPINMGSGIKKVVKARQF